MEIWKEFEANELTHSAAHHLLAIHQAGQQHGGWARVSDIAQYLGVTRGSVSISLRALKKRGLVEADDHHLIRLTPESDRIVHGVMAKKVAVKAFLRDVLAVPEDQAEIDSCKIEHLISQQTGERLIRFIRFLLSGNAQAKEAFMEFQRLPSQCPDVEHCPVCDGHCLTEELKMAS